MRDAKITAKTKQQLLFLSLEVFYAFLEPHKKQSYDSI